MAIAPFEAHQEPAGFLASVRAAMQDFAASFQQAALLQTPKELAGSVAAIEEISKTVEQLQLIGAHAVEQQNIAAVGETDQRLTCADPAQEPGEDGKAKKPEFKDTAEYLRSKLHISRSEAKRRLRVGSSTMPSTLMTGEQAPPKFARLGAVLATSAISGQAATLIRDALERVRPMASDEDLAAMEQQLTLQAAESDLDVLREIIKRWEAGLDPDGREPSDELLRAKQGVFIRGKRQGLHRIEIAATDEQYEYLITVMNAATNPRLRTTFAAENDDPPATGPCVSEDNPELSDEQQDPAWQGPTRQQKLLQGLVGACQIALCADKLPSSGGHRPQIMITMGYQDLIDRIGTSGHAVFGGLITPKTVRKIACDADLIPIVLGGKGEVLDVGRAQRLFTPAQRRALVARDKGCAFPDCTMPAPWTEAHHIEFWKKHHGRTSVDKGVLLCSWHHHLVHDENWKIEARDGIPWFIPPRYIDPGQKPRRNRYRYAGVALPTDPSRTGILQDPPALGPAPVPAEHLGRPSAPPTKPSLTGLPHKTNSTNGGMPYKGQQPQEEPDDWNQPFDNWPLQPAKPPW